MTCALVDRGSDTSSVIWTYVLITGYIKQQHGVEIEGEGSGQSDDDDGEE